MVRHETITARANVRGLRLESSIKIVKGIPGLGFSDASRICWCILLEPAVSFEKRAFHGSTV
jgi:hypothetical protein